MADTKQFTIMKRLTTLLEGVTPGNGYDYNLAGRVFRGRTVFGDKEPVPFVAILESMRPDSSPQWAGPENMVRVEDWEILIQGWAVTTAANPTDALYGLKGALEHRLSRVVDVDGKGNPVDSVNYRLGRDGTGTQPGLIIGMRIGPGVVRAAAPQSSATEALYLPVIISYKANVSDPWALD